MRIFLFILFTLLFTNVSKSQTIYGYNVSRLIDQLTDTKGELIPSFVEALIALEEVEALRFPHGTASTRYDIDADGYDNTGRKKYGKNAVHLFIPVVKAMDVPVTLVLPVGSYNRFFWELDQSKADEWLDKNRRLIQMFIDSGVPIFAVELGNEQYLHVPKGNVVPPTWTYNFFQRLLGQPNRDAKLRDEVLGYYRMYAEIYKKHSILVDSFGLDAAIPMVNNSNYKWQMWNEIIKDVPAKYGVWHHYEDKPESQWQSTIDSYLQAIREQNRIPICTEYNAWFGDNGTEFNRQNSTNGFMDKYNSWLKKYATQQKVPLIMKHRLNGDSDMRSGGTGSIPYDWFRID